MVEFPFVISTYADCNKYYPIEFDFSKFKSINEVIKSMDFDVLPLVQKCIILNRLKYKKVFEYDSEKIQVLINNLEADLLIQRIEEFADLLEFLDDKNEKIRVINEKIAVLKSENAKFELYNSPQISSIILFNTKEIKLFESLREQINAERDRIILTETEDHAAILNIQNHSITTSLMLFKELGIFDLLKERINENGGTDIDLERLIAYLIKHPNPDSVGRYFPAMIQGSKAKNSPYTKYAIKKMKEILKECNIAIKGKYPNKLAKN